MVAAVALMLAACENEVILEGLREDTRSPAYDITDAAAVAEASAAAAAPKDPENRSLAAGLGPVQAVGAWTHRGGNTAHLLPHATLSAAPQIVWSAKAGAGNSRRGRITAEPVAADGRIFTLDADGGVMAHGLNGGALWSADLTAPGETQGAASGGGLALGAGLLFATTGYGELVALDPASGKLRWRQGFNAPVSGAPTVSGGSVFVTSANSEVFAIAADTGRIQWRSSGLPSHSGVAGVAAPAIAGNDVLVPMANGSLIGFDATTGEAKWVARVAGDRPFRGSTVLQGFTGEPVVAGGTVYVGTPAGRAAAVGLDGTVRWTVTEGAKGMMAVAGGSVFMVSDELKLVRLSASTGERIWAVDLPRYTRDKPRRYKEIYPSYGPVPAGGRLWVASADGFLRGFDPANGALVATVELPDGAASRPIAVGGALYLMTTGGDLLALR